MEHTPQHSLLPWKTEGRTIWADDRLVAGCAIMHMDDGEPEGNATFIAQACNNHDELVKALRQCHDALAYDVTPAEWSAAEIKARAILQRTEKGE